MTLPSLNFEKYDFKFRKIEEKIYIFDFIRKKFVILLPEEWVRQNVVTFLIKNRAIPESLINVEKQLKIGRVTKRYDIITYAPDGRVLLSVECKAPQVNISQKTFDQIARYNMTLQAKFLMITNGIQHFIFQSNTQKKKYVFLKELPTYKTLLNLP